MQPFYHFFVLPFKRTINNNPNEDTIMKYKTIYAVFLLLTLIFYSSCEKPGETGRLVIQITDDPFPMEMIEEARINIIKVELRKAGEDLEDPYLNIFEDNVELNLVDLRNGITSQLLDIEVPAGNYDLIRLYVDNASLSVKDGDRYDVKVPSGAQTGIKIFVKPEIEVGDGITAELLLDFDLSKSFVLKGNYRTPAGIKGFNFKPVIRAVNNSTAGRIEGEVSDTAAVVIPNASVWMEQDSVIASAFTDTTGYYSIIGLPTGIYTLYATKEKYDTVMSDVVIIAANRTIRNITLTPKE